MIIVFMNSQTVWNDVIKKKQEVKMIMVTTLARLEMFLKMT